MSPPRSRRGFMWRLVLFAFCASAVAPTLAQAQPRFQCEELACPEGGMARGPYPSCGGCAAPISCPFSAGYQYICTPHQADPFILPELSCDCLAGGGDPDEPGPPELPIFCQAFCPDGSTAIENGLTCLCRTTFEAPPAKRAPSDRTAAGRSPAAQFNALSTWNRLRLTLRSRPALCAAGGRAG